VTLAWDPNAEPDVSGYMVAWGTAPGREDGIVNVGNITQHFGQPARRPSLYGSTPTTSTASEASHQLKSQPR
jgi:hypothetical protein